MALLNSTVFTGIADRMAKQYSLLKVAFDALSLSGEGTSYYDRLSGTGDPDVELDMLKAAHNADQMWAVSTPRLVLPSLPEYLEIVSSFILHLIREGSLTETTWDAFCEGQGVRVSDYTNQVHYVKYGTWMKARNVFCEADTVFATCEMTDGTTLAFTDGNDYGTGADANQASGSNFAGTQLQVTVTGSNTIAGLTVDVEGLDENGDSKTIQSVVISGAPGEVVTVGETTDRWVDVTTVTRVSGGADGDSFTIGNIKEREIAL